jgi:ubiquinone/menaquinone biosynthesis C-methylase UbiE
MLPTYLRTPPSGPQALIGRILTWLTQLPIQLFIRLFLRPRGGTVGGLSTKEVMAVYDREARSYDWKHHFTTRGQDTVWRREAAWCVLNMARRLHRPVDVLDLCTGTGLTIVEIEKVLKPWQRSARITGVDLNGPMLEVAKRRFDQSATSIKFTQDDAGKLANHDESMDVVTQVFGIGGIPYPEPVFNSVLRVLRPGGEFCLIDMHQPITDLPGEMPLPWGWKRTAKLEAATYSLTTIPLALARLWGWRDTTRDFYLAPCTTIKSSGQWYGFETIWFTQQSERWWFGLPVMPTARLLLRKVPISECEANQRQRIMEDLLENI